MCFSTIIFFILLLFSIGLLFGGGASGVMSFVCFSVCFCAICLKIYHQGFLFSLYIAFFNPRYFARLQCLFFFFVGHFRWIVVSARLLLFFVDFCELGWLQSGIGGLV